MRELRFTLYEVLGYFLPGPLTFVALVFVLWGVHWPYFQTDLINRATRRDLAVT